MKHLFVLLLSALCMGGCSNLDRYERSYRAQYDPATKLISGSVTLRPISGGGKLVVPLERGPSSGLSAEDLAKIAAIVSAAREAVTHNPDLPKP